MAFFRAIIFKAIKLYLSYGRASLVISYVAEEASAELEKAYR